MDCFPMADMDEVTLILGVDKKLYEEGMSAFMQNDYIQNILERCGMLDCNFIHTPGYGLELSEEQPEEHRGIGTTISYAHHVL